MKLMAVLQIAGAVENTGELETRISVPSQWQISNHTITAPTKAEELGSAQVAVEPVPRLDRRLPGSN